MCEFCQDASSWVGQDPYPYIASGEEDEELTEGEEGATSEGEATESKEEEGEESTEE